jgi:hypothetical protein
VGSGKGESKKFLASCNTVAHGSIGIKKKKKENLR